MKILYLSIIPLLIFSSSILTAQAMLTPFFGHTLTQDFVNEQLRAHQDWIAVSSTNSSQDYVGPGQCSPFFNLNMRQGSLAYPHLNDVQLDLLTPTKIIENQTMPIQLQVTNNENYTLYNVTMLDWDGNEFFDLRNLSEIYVLEPHQSKTITGNLTFATKNGITCFHYNGGESRPALGYQISAKNQTGTMMESHYFNSEIAVKILAPLKQLNSGITAINVECNQGLQLIIKSEDGSPTCVKPDTAQILVERGWAKEITKPETLTTMIPINPNETLHPSNLPLIPPAQAPAIPPHVFPNGTTFVNYTALAYSKIPNWNQKFSCTKYTGYAIQLTAEISNALNFSAMVTDPNGVIHNVKPVAMNSTQMQIQFAASASDPDGNYVVAFKVVNGTNTSNVNFDCTGTEMIEPRLPPALHAPPP